MAIEGDGEVVAVAIVGDAVAATAIDGDGVVIGIDGDAGDFDIPGAPDAIAPALDAVGAAPIPMDADEVGRAVGVDAEGLVIAIDCDGIGLPIGVVPDGAAVVIDGDGIAIGEGELAAVAIAVAIAGDAEGAASLAIAPEAMGASVADDADISAIPGMVNHSFAITSSTYARRSAWACARWG